jgi:hypothetical protein
VEKKTLLTATLSGLIFLAVAQVAVVKANMIISSSIEIQSPINYKDRIYQTSTIDISVWAAEVGSSPGIKRISYSLDGKPNVTLSILIKGHTESLGTGTLENLTDGYHFLKAYALPVLGREMSTSTTFLVNTTFRYPTLLLSPLNVTYSNNEIPLTYTINEQAKYVVYYRLDNSPNYTSITGNNTLTELTEGQHTITIKAINGFSLYSEQTTYFTINTTESEKPLATSNSTITLVIATIAIIIGASLAVIAYKRRKLKQQVRG